MNLLDFVRLNERRACARAASGVREHAMAASGKKRIQASEVYIGNTTVEARLLLLSEEAKEDRVQAREDRAQIKAILARMDQTDQQFHAKMQEMRDEMRGMTQRMDQTEQDIRTIASAMMAMAQRMDARISTLEHAAQPAG